MLESVTFVLLDAACVDTYMSEAIMQNPNNECLYLTRDEENDLKGIAPHLFQFTSETDFSNWYLKKGWGKAWGLLSSSLYPFDEIYRHFRRFLMVKTEEGEQLYFRFYDPRVLRNVLPTFDKEQTSEFFGGELIDFFLLEDEDPAYALKFWHQNGELQTERIAVTDEIAALPEPLPLPPVQQEPLPPETIAALKASGHWETVKGELGLQDEEEFTGGPNAASDAEEPAPGDEYAPIEYTTDRVDDDEPAAEKPETQPPPVKKNNWKMFD